LTTTVRDHNEHENPEEGEGQTQQEPKSTLSQPEKGKDGDSDP